jgi:hypothetical protein
VLSVRLPGPSTDDGGSEVKRKHGGPSEGAADAPPPRSEASTLGLGEHGRDGCLVLPALES